MSWAQHLAYQASRTAANTVARELARKAAADVYKSGKSAMASFGAYMKARHANPGSRRRTTSRAMKRARYTVPYKSRGYLRAGGSYGRYQGKWREQKWLDTAIAQSDVTATGVIFPSFNLVAQGTSENQRIGHKILIKSLDMRLCIYKSHDPALTDAQMAASVIRIIVFVDKQANGAAATMADLLADSNAVVSHYNTNHELRFRILSDRIHKLEPIGTFSDTAGDAQRPGLSKYVNVKKSLNLPEIFSSTAGVISELQSNNIGMLAVVSSSGTGFNLEGTVRIRYYD